MIPLPACIQESEHTTDNEILERLLYLEYLVRQTIADAEVQARLSLSHEVQPSMTGCGVWDELRRNSGVLHLALLEALPAVGMRQHKLDAIFERVPEVFAVSVRFVDVRAGACEEVGQEVGEDIDDVLASRQRRKPPTHSLVLCVEALGTEV